MSSAGMPGKGSIAAKVALPDCSLQTLLDRSQADFEIDFFERILTRDPGNQDVLKSLGDLFADKGWHRRAQQIDLRLAALRPHDPLVHYNLACSHALLRQVDDALRALQKALCLGFRDVDALRNDPDLAILRTRREFKALLAAIVREDA